MNESPPRPSVRSSDLANYTLLAGLLIMVFGMFVFGPLRPTDTNSIFQFCQFAGLLNAILGLVALRQIRKSHGQLFGRLRAIIGIGLGLLLVLSSPSPPQSEALLKKARAHYDVQLLRVASTAFHAEYGRWPKTRNWADLILVLNWLKDPITNEDISKQRPDLLEQNPHRIQFIEFRIRDLTPSHSSKPSGNAELAFFDPWGTPYSFAFDNGLGGIYYRGPGNAGSTPWPDATGEDNTIPMPFGSGTINAGCAFFSNGPDGRTGTEKDAEDDIQSW